MPLIALQAYARGKGDPPQTSEDVRKHVYHSETKRNANSFPYLEGGDISRYHITWSGSYLEYGKWLAEPQTLSRFSGPRVLLREIISPLPYLLNASVVTDTMLYNKSVLHVIAKEDPDEDRMWALAAILNSKLASFVIRYRGRKSQRGLFPKIVNADLKGFPVPKDLDNARSELASLCKRISKTVEAEERNELAGMQHQIDQAVYAAYGLTPDLIQVVEDSLR